MVDDNSHVIEVITKLENGSKIRFKIKYNMFIKSLKNDRKAGMKMWIEDDTIHAKYENYLKITNLTYGSVSGKLEKVYLEAGIKQQTKESSPPYD